MDIEDETEVTGSIIFEDPGTGELTLNFYTSTFDSVQKELKEYPQSPL